MAVSIVTTSGGEITLAPSKTGIKGHELYFYIDQTSNIKTGEGDAGINITPDECKRLILLLNEYVSFVEGKSYVALIDYTNNNGKDIKPIDDDSISSDGDFIIGG
jgi:hypothetical protein